MLLPSLCSLRVALANTTRKCEREGVEDHDYEVHITEFHKRSPEPLNIRGGKKNLSETIGSTSVKANSTHTTLQEEFILWSPSLIHVHIHRPAEEQAWSALSEPNSFLRNGRWKIQAIFYK